MHLPEPHPARPQAELSVSVVQIFRLNGLRLACGDVLAEPAGQTSIC